MPRIEIRSASSNQAPGCWCHRIPHVGLPCHAMSAVGRPSRKRQAVPATFTPRGGTCALGSSGRPGQQLGRSGKAGVAVDEGDERSRTSRFLVARRGAEVRWRVAPQVEGSAILQGPYPGTGALAVHAGSPGGISRLELRSPGPLAQLAEQRTFNPRVLGSIPRRPTRLTRANAVLRPCRTEPPQRNPSGERASTACGVRDVAHRPGEPWVRRQSRNVGFRHGSRTGRRAVCTEAQRRLLHARTARRLAGSLGGRHLAANDLRAKLRRWCSAGGRCAACAPCSTARCRTRPGRGDGRRSASWRSR